MPRMPHLERRGGTYWFRFKLPGDLRAKPVPKDWPQALALLVSTSRAGHLKNEIKHSLRTSDAKVAKRRAALSIAEVETLCDYARSFLARGVSHGDDGLSPDVSAALANDFHAALLAIDEQMRKGGLGSERPLMLAPDAAPREPGMSGVDLKAYSAHIADREADTARSVAASRPSARAKQAASARLSAAAIDLPEGSPALRDLELDFAAAERRALRDVQARLSGEIVPTPALGPAQGKSAGPTIRQAFDRWAAGDPVRGARKPGAAVVAEGETILRRFIELHGNMPIAEITKRHARELLHGLARIPKGLPEHLRAMKLPALLKRDLSKYEPRAAATVNKSMQVLGGVLSRAEKDGYFDELPMWSNPFHIAIDVNAIELEPYQPFDVAELNKLFASPVYSEGKRPIGGRGEVAFWLPVLGLFTGARRTELLQLAAGDVRQDADTGVWFFAFHAEGDNRLKTAASRRATPLHPELIRLGFLDYALERARKKGPKAPLWEGFSKPIAPKAKAWTKWFSRYLATHVVDHPAKAFHSFRGTFKRFARASGLEEHVVDALVGHAGHSVGRKYGRRADAQGVLDAGFPLARLAEEMARVAVPGLVVSAKTTAR
mgnify:CR=1 FL=1